MNKSTEKKINDLHKLYYQTAKPRVIAALSIVIIGIILVLLIGSLLGANTR